MNTYCALYDGFRTHRESSFETVIVDTLHQGFVNSLRHCSVSSSYVNKSKFKQRLDTLCMYVRYAIRNDGRADIVERDVYTAINEAWTKHVSTTKHVSASRIQAAFRGWKVRMMYRWDPSYRLGWHVVQ